jgi:predicted DsbA family dithiol-disulfide isomerase
MTDSSKGRKMTATARTELRVDIVSDVMCPWCFIGKKNLEEASRIAEGVDLNISWRPYQLDPTIPQEGIDRRAYMIAKFGTEERLKTIHQRVEEAGKAAGIDFDFDAIEVSPNSMDAHRLIRWAGSVGPHVQNRVVARLFEVFFTQGGNVGDHEVLAGIAKDCGMDGELVRNLLAGDADRDAVRQEIALAQQIGVTGVPCFIIDGKHAVMGAQPAELLARAFEQIASEKADEHQLAGQS